MRSDLVALLTSPTHRPRLIPTRDQVCAVQLTFQGLTVQTAEFGSLPWFEIALDQLSAADRQQVYAAKHAMGDTHLALAISHAYLEPGIPPPLCTGKDWTNDLAGFKTLVYEVIDAGFIPMIFLAGDAQSNPDGGYNDPIGWTYGFQWLCANLPRILLGLVDLIPSVLFVTGFDSVFYGWEPDQVAGFGALFRDLAPDGYLAIEHNTGHLPIGNGEADWAPNGPMLAYDVLLSEFENFPITGGATWEIAARSLGPAYVRPPDQPAGDDPRPPYYLSSPTPRGPVYPIAFEWDLYQTIRQRDAPGDVARGRAYYKALGYRYVC